MCHGYEWELLMARAREVERRKQEKSKPEAVKHLPQRPLRRPSSGPNDRRAG